jgi:hypothetical protein
MAITADRSAVKAMWLNLGVAFLSLGLFEVYLYHRQSGQEAAPVRYQGSYSDGYFTGHEILGYAPTKDSTVHSKKFVGESVAYDAVYTIDRNGLRVSQKDVEGISDSTKGCIVIFGDSFAFGEGVNDEETLPYRVGRRSGYKVYNFGFHGYGPHHMLASLKHRLVQEIVSCVPRLVVFYALMDIGRPVGRAPWDTHGPKYIMDEKGAVQYAGHFDDARPAWMTRLGHYAEKSSIYRRAFGSERPLTPEDLRLYVAVIETSRQICLDLFPQSGFHVILEAAQDYTQVKDALALRDIPVHSIAEIIEDYRSDNAKYVIPHDGHPNALAHERVAQFVTESIVLK